MLVLLKYETLMIIILIMVILERTLLFLKRIYAGITFYVSIVMILLSSIIIIGRIFGFEMNLIYCIVVFLELGDGIARLFVGLLNPMGPSMVIGNLTAIAVGATGTYLAYVQQSETTREKMAFEQSESEYAIIVPPIVPMNLS